MRMTKYHFIRPAPEVFTYSIRQSPGLKLPMCGIAGIAAWTPTRGLSAVVQAMTNALARRGPDGEGSWTDSEAGVGLGHRRLAILDLSERGHQPMLSHRSEERR